MSKSTGIKSLKPNTRNPRRPFSQEQLDAFAKSVRKFGDLSGIVRNIRSDQLVGGHKRREDFASDPKAAVVITERFSKPDRTGTTAVGYVTAHGTRWSYREVDWDAKTEIAANLAANQHGAEFDWAGVNDMLKEIGDAFDQTITGFSRDEIDSLLNKFKPPTEFPTVDENTPIEHVCPKCKYRWSGKPS